MIRFPESGIIHVTDVDAVVPHVKGFVVPSLTRRTQKLTSIPSWAVGFSVVEVPHHKVKPVRTTVEFTRFGIALLCFLNLLSKVSESLANGPTIVFDQLQESIAPFRLRIFRNFFEIMLITNLKFGFDHLCPTSVYHQVGHD